ncbi:MAG: ankyrin repeat domain-containing protein [Gemmatimonadetes bacterium]|nr:ankyrin repeat domain-containing protein [Gemmatimonadota bacterium]
MSSPSPAPTPLSYRAPLGDYLRLAEHTLAALHAGDEATAWRFKWMHPRFRGVEIAEVRAATLGLDDAKLLVAREYCLEDWHHLARFASDAAGDGRVARFEAAADAVIDGNGAALERMLRDDPSLPRARSARIHHATLLHYVAANGVEGYRQRTPANAVEIARLLLDAGADPDALADMYDERCTTLGMLVSSTPPHDAGVQVPLAELLVERGATPDVPGSKWNAALRCALAFGFLDTARALAARVGQPSDIGTAAGLGELGETARFLPTADDASRQTALALACMHGHARVARLLLATGGDPDRYNPEGLHAHSTPLHQAVWANHLDVVRLLVEHGARLDLRDRIYDGTPLDWAVHGARNEIADYLRDRSGTAAPATT